MSAMVGAYRRPATLSPTVGRGLRNGSGRRCPRGRAVAGAGEALARCHPAEVALELDLELSGTVVRAGRTVEQPGSAPSDGPPLRPRPPRSAGTAASSSERPARSPTGSAPRAAQPAGRVRRRSPDVELEAPVVPRERPSFGIESLRLDTISTSRTHLSLLSSGTGASACGPRAEAGTAARGRVEGGGDVGVDPVEGAPRQPAARRRRPGAVGGAGRELARARPGPRQPQPAGQHLGRLPAGQRGAPRGWRPQLDGWSLGRRGEPPLRRRLRAGDADLRHLRAAVAPPGRELPAGRAGRRRARRRRLRRSAHRHPQRHPPRLHDRVAHRPD